MKKKKDIKQVKAEAKLLLWGVGIAGVLYIVVMDDLRSPASVKPTVASVKPTVTKPHVVNTGEWDHQRMLNHLDKLNEEERVVVYGASAKQWCENLTDPEYSKCFKQRFSQAYKFWEKEVIQGRLKAIDQN